MRNTRLKVARIQAGLTQQELALLVAVREHDITRYETGRASPPQAIKKRIAELLKCATFEIFDN